jgi:hypothetical protein
MFILTHPVNFPCGWKLDCPEKTHDFRQSVDKLITIFKLVRTKNRTHACTLSEVKGICSDDKIDKNI